MDKLLELLKQAQAEALDPQSYEVGAAVQTLDKAIALAQPKPMVSLSAEFHVPSNAYVVWERVDSLSVRLAAGPFETRYEAERYAKDQAPA